MPDPDDITRLQVLLAAHRERLAVVLRQVALHGADYAPPGVHHGIAEARDEIARLTAALRAAGVAVEDQAGDVAAPDEVAGPVDAPARGVRQTIEGGDHNIQAVDSTVTLNQFGDHVGGDKVGDDKIGGDKVAGNKYETHYHSPQPRPTIDLDEAQQLLDRLPLDTIPDPAPALPPDSRMPLRRNPLFVGRDADLRGLAKILKGGGAAAITTGIGGVGKTQLAAEFAHRYGQFFMGGVFWLSFADPAGIDAEIAACGGAGALELYRDTDGLALDEQVARVRAAWQSVLPRLLIFDNCEDEALLQHWYPSSGSCRVLITSRRATWDPALGVQARPLDVLSRAESLMLLQKFRPDLPEHDTDLAALAAELGDLPLALHLAGSFLKHYHTEVRPTDYLAELRGPTLLAHESLQGVDLAVSPTNHPLQVGRTFALSYERLDTGVTDTLARAVLARAAFFAPGEPIPRELLLATVAVSDTATRRQVSRALNRLIDLGLLEPKANGAQTLHRLLAAFVQSIIVDEAAQAAVERVLITTAHDLNMKGYPAPLLALQTHLRYVTEATVGREDERAESLCNELGYYLKMIRDYTRAQLYYARALKIRERVLGSDHPATAISISNLAWLLKDQGGYSGPI